MRLQNLDRIMSSSYNLHYLKIINTLAGSRRKRNKKWNISRKALCLNNFIAWICFAFINLAGQIAELIQASNSAKYADFVLVSCNSMCLHMQELESSMMQLPHCSVAENL